MKIVVTLDDNGQVEVYATKDIDVVLIDNSVPEDAGGYREETITTEDGQYVITGAVIRMQGPHKDKEFVRKVFAIAERGAPQRQRRSAAHLPGERHAKEATIQACPCCRVPSSRSEGRSSGQ